MHVHFPSDVEMVERLDNRGFDLCEPNDHGDLRIHDVRSNTDGLNCENDKVLTRLGP